MNDILKDIDAFIGSEKVVPREEMRPTVLPSPASLPPLPPIPPPHQSSPMHQRTRKKGGVRKMWDKLKELFAIKFKDQPRPKLSDKLVPELDDEAKWHEPLFSKPPKPAKMRK